MLRAAAAITAKPGTVYDEAHIHERSPMIALAFDARVQYYPGETQYQYEPLIGEQVQNYCSEAQRDVLLKRCAAEALQPARYGCVDDRGWPACDFLSAAGQTDFNQHLPSTRSQSALHRRAHQHQRDVRRKRRRIRSVHRNGHVPALRRTIGNFSTSPLPVSARSFTADIVEADAPLPESLGRRHGENGFSPLAGVSLLVDAHMKLFGTGPGATLMAAHFLHDGLDFGVYQPHGRLLYGTLLDAQLIYTRIFGGARFKLVAAAVPAPDTPVLAAVGLLACIGICHRGRTVWTHG